MRGQFFFFFFIITVAKGILKVTWCLGMRTVLIVPLPSLWKLEMVFNSTFLYVSGN